MNLKLLRGLVLGLLLLPFSQVAVAGDPSAVGDVLARDLNTKGLGWAGHVGMWDGSKVVEVLNKKPVIQKNTLAEFKDESSYWGARYGKGKNHYKVVAEAWQQRLYAPNYQYTSIYQVGKYFTIKVPYFKRWRLRWKTYRLIKQAKYRCDTFVYRHYDDYGSADLKPWYKLMLPRTIYNSMPNAR